MIDPFEQQDKTLGMSTPEGYFEEFQQKMELQIKLQNQPSALKVPSGYFQEFPDKMLREIQFKQTESALKTPEGYFEDLHQRLEAKIAFVQNTHKQDPQPRKAKLSPRLWRWAMATAAVVSGLVFGASLLWFSDSTSLTPVGAIESYSQEITEDEYMFSTMSDYDVYEYLYAGN